MWTIPSRRRFKRPSRREQRGWTGARASGGPRSGPQTSPRWRETARREQARRDIFQRPSRREQRGQPFQALKTKVGPSISGPTLERRNSGMIELSPPGGSERYEACKKDTPPKPSVSGFGGERRSSGMSDTCRTAAGGAVWSLLRRGAVMVSTGALQQE